MSEGGNRLWAAYVRAVAGDVPAQAIVDRIAERYERTVSQPTVSRWIRGTNSGELKPGNVAAFATAYERPVLQAFLAAGLLEVPDVRRGLAEDEIAFVGELGDALMRPGEPVGRAPRGRSPRSPRE